MNYRIVILRINGHQHSHAFDEVATSVAWGLRELGHQVVIGHDFHPQWPDGKADIKTIVFGAHLYSTSMANHGPWPRDAIVYNLEHPASHMCSQTKQLVQAAVDNKLNIAVWDYSVQNVMSWRALGIDAHWQPVSYAPTLVNVDRAKEADRDIDVLFYGCINERRERILNELAGANLKVHVLQNKYGTDRNALMARAKVVLNVHYYLPPIFEIVRVSHCWANRVAVVSEESGDVTSQQRVSMVTVEYDNLVPACIGLVSLPGVREDLEDVAFTEFKKSDIRFPLEAALRPQ